MHTPAGPSNFQLVNIVLTFKIFLPTPLARPHGHAQVVVILSHFYVQLCWSIRLRDKETCKSIDQTLKICVWTLVWCLHLWPLGFSNLWIFEVMISRALFVTWYCRYRTIYAACGKIIRRHMYNALVVGNIYKKQNLNFESGETWNSYTNDIKQY